MQCAPTNQKEIDMGTVHCSLTYLFCKKILYKDTVDLTVTPDDEKAKMKVKTPERTDEDKLKDYDGEDENTITYKEEELTSGDKYPVTLNKLGEPDTKITITVTAEDGKTTKEYTVTIKRPYGIIKGKIHTQSSIDNHSADIRIFKSEDVKKEIDWGTIKSGNTDNIHEQLMELPYQEYKANTDGTYEIYVIPETYDVLIDRAGYLDEIYTDRKVIEGKERDLGEKELTPGDVNKDGVVQIADLTELISVYGAASTEPSYNIKYDFNEDSETQIADLTILISNFSTSREIN